MFLSTLLQYSKVARGRELRTRESSDTAFFPFPRIFRSSVVLDAVTRIAGMVAGNTGTGQTQYRPQSLGLDFGKLNAVFVLHK